jgi:Cu/Zn superoxide dismutase
MAGHIVLRPLTSRKEIESCSMRRGKFTQVKVVSRLTPLLVGLALMIVLSGCGVTPRASQEEVAKGWSTSPIRLELPPTNNSGVSGSATFRKEATGTRVELELRGLPEPNEIYLAHVHAGSCEDEVHADAPESGTADHHSHEYGHEEHAEAQVQEENYEATTDGIEYPLTPVESNAAGEGSSTTMLDYVALSELLWHKSRYLNVHAAGSGDPPQLACGDLSEVR